MLTVTAKANSNRRLPSTRQVLLLGVQYAGTMVEANRAACVVIMVLLTLNLLALGASFILPSLSRPMRTVLNERPPRVKQHVQYVCSATNGYTRCYTSRSHWTKTNKNGYREVSYDCVGVGTQDMVARNKHNLYSSSASQPYVSLHNSVPSHHNPSATNGSSTQQCAVRYTHNSGHAFNNHNKSPTA